MDTQMSYIQTGWTVRTSDGQDLGLVIDLTHDAMMVRGKDGQRRTVSKALIEEEDEGAQLAILSAASGDLEAGTGRD